MAKLAEAILDRRVQSPNYFQGRLLTATDLTAERNAHLLRQRMLGQAIGKGIVEGLWVEKSDPRTNEPFIKVSKGFAINAQGELLSLEGEQTLALTEPPEKPSVDSEACLFKPCNPPEIKAVPTGAGFYLLVMSPTSRFEEQAPMSSLQDAKASPSCGRKWAVPGVIFRLQPFDPRNVPGINEATHNALVDLLTDAPDPAALSRLRNLVVHLCFGSDEIAGHSDDPWANDEADKLLLTGYGTVDYLLGLNSLTGCDVPLAMIYWSDKGLEFVDCWAVRRRPISPSLSAEWPSLSGHRLRAENEARLFQFQDHLRWLLDSELVHSQIKARYYFRYLPAAGLLPLATGNRTGFTVLNFFDDVPHPHRKSIQYINGEQLRSILDQSWNYPPVDLAAASQFFSVPPEEEEMVWLYRPWQQEKARTAGKTDRSYVVFTSAHMSPMNLPRFNVARWDYSHYPSA
jgi:hypothetical protein